MVRHGETEWSANGRHTSRTDLPLTPDGEAEAKSLAPLLMSRSFSLVLTSPKVRAMRTAELAGVTGTVTDPDLSEWDYGEYEGITTAAIHEHRPGWDLWTDGAPPPGESPDQVAARADRVLARVAPALEKGDVLLVAHGHFLRVLTARHLGFPPQAGRAFLLLTGTVSRFSTEHGHPVVAAWNARPGQAPC